MTVNAGPIVPVKQPPPGHIMEAAKKKASLPKYGGVKRFLPQLCGVSDIVIDFLTQGADYDGISVERAAHEANILFDRGEYLKCLDLYAAAYEIFRFLPPSDRYFPVGHDVMLRRVVCLSIVGRFEQALEESLIVLAIMPNSPACYFFQGVLFSKLNDTVNANAAFQRCVIQQPDYKPVVDVIVGIFMHMSAYFDHSISIAGKVLQICGDGADEDKIEPNQVVNMQRDMENLALILRADSYKFHTKGYYASQAADDYATLFEKYPNTTSYMGQGFSLKTHELLETCYIKNFTRIYDAVRPLQFLEYPMWCQIKVQNMKPLDTLGMVIVFAGKLISRSKATRLLKRMEKEQEGLRKRREDLQLQLEALTAQDVVIKKKVVETKVIQKKGDGGTIVWGPADPDLVHVTPYRRYWMEQPPRAPKVKEKPRSQSADARKKKKGDDDSRAAAKHWTVFSDLDQIGGPSAAAAAMRQKEQEEKEAKRKKAEKEKLDDDYELEFNVQAEQAEDQMEGEHNASTAPEIEGLHQAAPPEIEAQYDAPDMPSQMEGQHNRECDLQDFVMNENAASSDVLGSDVPTSKRRRLIIGVSAGNNSMVRSRSVEGLPFKRGNFESGGSSGSNHSPVDVPMDVLDHEEAMECLNDDITAMLLGDDDSDCDSNEYSDSECDRIRRYQGRCQVDCEMGREHEQEAGNSFPIFFEGSHCADGGNGDEGASEGSPGDTNFFPVPLNLTTGEPLGSGMVIANATHVTGMNGQKLKLPLETSLDTGTEAVEQTLATTKPELRLDDQLLSILLTKDAHHKKHYPAYDPVTGKAAQQPANDISPSYRHLGDATGDSNLPEQMELRHKAVFNVSDGCPSMDQIILAHKVPAHETLDINRDIDDRAIHLALERPTAAMEIPPKTGENWTDEEWRDNAVLAADRYVAEEGLSPVTQRLPKETVVSINAHLMGRATYNKKDVIELVVEQGLDQIEDFFEELDSIHELTNMQAVAFQPRPPVGIYQVRDPRHFILKPGEPVDTSADAEPPLKSSGVTLDFRRSTRQGGLSAKSEKDAKGGGHIARQFKGRIMRDQT